MEQFIQQQQPSIAQRLYNRPLHLLEHILANNQAHPTATYHHLSIYRYCKLLYLLFLIPRLLFYSFAIKEYDENNRIIWLQLIHHYDPWLSILSQQYMHNSVIALSVVPLVFFTIALDYLFYIKPNINLWSQMYQLVVLNEKHFSQLNPAISRITINWFNPLDSLINLKNTLHNLRHYRAPLFYSRLSHFPHLSAKIRFKLLLFSITYRLLLNLMHLIQLLVMSTLYLVGMLLMCLATKYSLPQILFAVLDGALCTLATIHCFTLLTNFVYYLYLYLAAHYLHLSEINNLLTTQYSYQCRLLYSMKQPKILLLLLQLLNFFHAEHLTIALHIYQFNSHLFSTLAAFLIGSNVFSNIFFITAITYGQFNFFQNTITAGFIVLQLGSIYFLALPLVLFTERLYSSAKYLFLYQRFLSWRTVAAKLKLSYYYEFLHTDKPIQFTAGGFGAFSRSAMYQFLLAYSAYLIYYFKLFRTHRLKID